MKLVVPDMARDTPIGRKCSHCRRPLPSHTICEYCPNHIRIGQAIGLVASWLSMALMAAVAVGTLAALARLVWRYALMGEA